MRTTATCLVAVALLLMMTSCRKYEFREKTIHLPGLKNRECAEIVSRALQAYCSRDGLQGSIDSRTIRFDYRSRTVSFKCNTMQTELKNLEHLIAGAGFQADEIDADSNAFATLPSYCR